MIAEPFISLHVHDSSGVVLEVDGDALHGHDDKVLGARVVRTIHDAHDSVACPAVGNALFTSCGSALLTRCRSALLSSITVFWTSGVFACSWTVLSP